MANLVLFGVPAGLSTSKCDESEKSLINCFYCPHKPGIELRTYRRPDNTVHYVYLVYEKEGSMFLDVNGRGGSFFGMDLILKDNYITNTQILLKVFQKTYNDYVKDKIIKEFPGGNRKYLIQGFENADDSVARFVGGGMTSIMKNPEFSLGKYVKPLSAVVQGQNKSRI